MVTAVFKKAQISVRGIVQGVGFRPFVYQLANSGNLKGWVCNTSGDVKIEVEGKGEAIDQFLDRLQKNAPPVAQIEDIKLNFTDPSGYRQFVIRDSRSEEGKYQLVSPDIATCQLCQTEIFDSKDRHYRYPFTNCTNCGPRFTIIEDIPYDRAKTTMRQFKMCPDCQEEYENPLNRRFHAQPNACPHCGPQVELTDSKGRTINSKDPVFDTARLLEGGAILAIKGLGGFLLACDATNEKAVHLLRQRKLRPFKPLAVMISTLEEIQKYCIVSEEEKALLTSPPSPIVLLRRRRLDLISPAVAPNIKYLGVMLPYTPLHHLIMREVDRPLVMTSGNVSEEPIAKDNDEALGKLGNIADYFLFHNRDIHARYDDSVTLVERGDVKMIRRARGYAPEPIRLPFKAKEVLACGAELKNTFCLTKDEYAFISQHLGDLESFEVLTLFEDTIEFYKKLFRLKPKIVAYDLHPDYLSTKFALALEERCPGLQMVPIQHHHAHIVSLMAENDMKSPVIGVVFDGTGYGSDGNIWGGEFLLAEYGKFRRLGHLEYVPLPGGDEAARKPYRMAVSYLLTHFGKEILDEDLPFLEPVKKLEIEIIKKQIARGINAPLTSSSGRLFDAVSALIGVRGRVDYEAQAAIELEMIAAREIVKPDSYLFEIDVSNDTRIVRLRELFRGILSDLGQGRSQAEISARFHNTMALLVVKMCQKLAQSTGVNQVALSGGVFQNRLFSALTRKYLEEAGLAVFTHKEIPCNDGGISLGQAVAAHFITEEN
ncbi:MAG: carbamoyltransferase HypF [Deltaproteobacteria bacterium]|nr:carbamoyltransferase HypF [Deltaproteobacteria bacterium]MBW2142301.1 carbamoyltransferase HypF [Deltaproteobacteria bacterium]